MTILLCPDCLRWQDADRSCAACDGLMDLFAADPAKEVLSERIGDWRDCLGEVDVVRSIWPRRGWLHVTSNGLLFVPQSSSVVLPTNAEPAAVGTPIGLLSRARNWLFGAAVRDQQAGVKPLPSPREVAAMCSETLAELLLSDPGVVFVSRLQIVSWRRRWHSWELLRPDARWWPERLIPRDRDFQKRLLNWLETTACPKPTTEL